LYARLNADPAQARFVASNNLSLPTDRFRAIDGFDTTFTLAAGEDRELCDRWLAHGGRLIYAPEALVRHAHALTPVGFWRQQFHYGRGAAHIRRVRHAEPGLGHGGFEPASFYLDLLRYPASRAHGRRAAALVALMVLSQAAIAAGMLWEQTPRRPTRGVGTSG
jgi:GT2 family glycosyltransferase